MPRVKKTAKKDKDVPSSEANVDKEKVEKGKSRKQKPVLKVVVTAAPTKTSQTGTKSGTRKDRAPASATVTTASSTPSTETGKKAEAAPSTSQDTSPGKIQ